jgi:hypothetical protein
MQNNTHSGFTIAFASSALTALLCSLLIPFILNYSRAYAPIDYSLPWLESIETEIAR